MKNWCVLLVSCVLMTLAIAFGTPQAIAQIQVTSATPNSTTQGTVNLNVTITGKGFKNGAKAQWFVTGTTNPGGVVVNSSSFVNSTTLTANITVSDTAVIGNFDIQVANADGRTGKGTELFAIQSNTNNGTKLSMCTAPPIMPAINACASGGMGCFDNTWGGTGMVLTNTDGSVPERNDSEQGYTVAIQPDGKLLVIGQNSDPSNYAIQRPAAVRYNLDGTLDTAFGVNGVAMTTYGTGYVATSGVLQQDGKILVAGYTLGTTSGRVVASRFNPDGTVDATFGAGGTVVMPSQGVSAVAVQSDQKIVLTWTVSNSWTVARLNSNGTFDSSFGTGGMVSMNLGKKVSRTDLQAVTIQSTSTGGVTREFIVLGGNVNGVATLKRLTSTGSLDSSFGLNGTTTAEFCGATSRVNSLAIDYSGRILASGWMTTVSNGTPNGAVARFTANGALDTTFGDPSPTSGSTGMAGFNVLSGNNSLWGIAAQPDGRIVVSGFASDGTRYYMTASRLDADGKLDQTFGIGGVLAIDLGGDSSGGKQVAIQPDGKIVVTGNASFSSGSYAGYNFGTIRLLP